MLSIVIPAYNEEENIENTTGVLAELMRKNDISAEILYVDDGSKDKTWEIIERVSALSDDIIKIRGIRFSRNFGKEGAIFAGLKAAKGGAAVLMDCDLQHPPEVIVKMHKLWRDGFQIVEAVKSDRGKEGFVYKFFAKSFYKMMKSSANIDLDGASDFKLMDRKALDALNEMPERLTFFRALSSWIGFKTARVEFEVAPRAAGTTKWSFKTLFVFAVNSVTSFTNLPMHIMTLCGTLFMIFTIIFAAHTLVNYFSGAAQSGFTTVILLLLIVGALLMLGLGVMGFYLSKIYEEIKFRPRYIVDVDTDNN